MFRWYFCLLSVSPPISPPIATYCLLVSDNRVLLGTIPRDDIFGDFHSGEIHASLQ